MQKKFSYKSIGLAVVYILFFGLMRANAQTPTAPNYNNIFYWAAHPYKKDRSDSVSKSLPKEAATDTTVDVFFIHPTSYTDIAKPFGLNGSVDDENLNNKTDDGSILYQASVFNNAARVFAPRYRQAHISCYYSFGNTTDSLAAMQAFMLAYNDVKTAFEFYLKHYNNGRPFVIASHSQGTTHAKFLLREFIDGKPLQKQFVAGYLVGMYLETNWFTTIKPCATPTSTNCICAWRTFKEDFLPDYVVKEKQACVVTNPLSWDEKILDVNYKNNPGSLLKNFKIKPALVDAKVAENVLWTIKPKIFGIGLVLKNNYHIADYNFYYRSIRKNVKDRIEAFWKR